MALNKLRKPWLCQFNTFILVLFSLIILRYALRANVLKTVKNDQQNKDIDQTRQMKEIKYKIMLTEGILCREGRLITNKLLKLTEHQENVSI